MYLTFDMSVTNLNRGSLPGLAYPRGPLHRVAWRWSLALLASVWPFADGAAQQVDLELVLAVDSSSSVNYSEFDLQMRGLADAFRHPAVRAAIASATPNGIAVSLVQWSGDGEQVLAVDWAEIRGTATADAMARRIDATPRLVVGGATAIGSAIAYSTDLLRDNTFQGARRTIDISGDGINNQGEFAATARARAMAAGITVNGLAILNERPDLGTYYLAGVVGGPRSFLLTADDYDDFARAIRLKLITEISGSPLALNRDIPPPRRERLTVIDRAADYGIVSRSSSERGNSSSASRPAQSFSLTPASARFWNAFSRSPAARWSRVRTSPSRTTWRPST